MAGLSPFRALPRHRLPGGGMPAVRFRQMTVMATCMLFLAAGDAAAYDWRNRPPAVPWQPTPEQLEPCARVERDPDSLTYCKHKSDGRWTILDEALPSLIPGAYITFTDHEGRFCVYAHAPYANDGRSRPEATTSCRTPDGSFVPSDAIP